MSLYDFWVRYYFHEHPLDLETLIERILRVEYPGLVVEERGGSGGFGDAGRDVVIKFNRSDPEPAGVVQVSARENWRTKFRRELNAFIKKVSEGVYQAVPTAWLFATVQEVHERKSATGLTPGDKDDELRWAAGRLAESGITDVKVEIWGLNDVVAVVAHPEQGRQIRVEFSFPVAPEESVEQLVTAFDDFTRASLRGVIDELPVLGKLPRDETSLVLNHLEFQKASLVLGEGGTGKSALLADVARQTRERGTAVLLVRASSFSSNDGLEAIESRLGATEPLLAVIRKVAGVVPTLLIVDQLDSVSQTPLLAALVGLVGTAREVANVSVLVGCRTWQAEKEPELGRLTLPRVVSEPLTREQSADLLVRLGIADVSPVLADLATNLLNLSLIADLANAGEDVSSITGMLDLWHRYRRSIEEREGQEALSRAVELAKTSLAAGEREFALPIAVPPETGRLISRGVVVPSRGESYRFRHQEVQDYLFAWNAALRERRTAREVRDEIGERLCPGVLRWMLLMYLDALPEAATDLLREVLAGSVWGFFTRADLLDILLSLETPPPEVADAVAEPLKEASLAAYFFRRLDSPGWFKPLAERGVFASPPGVERTEDGWRPVAWFPGQYLVKMADSMPADVSQVVERIETDNPAVLHDLTQAAQRMQPEDAARLVPTIVKWLDIDPSWLLPHDCLEFAKSLAETGEWQSALAIASVLLEPALRNAPAGSVLPPEVVAKRDRHTAEDAAKALIPLVAQTQPAAAVRLAERLLTDAVRLEISNGRSRWSGWRHAIDDHAQNSSSDDYKSTVLEALRDSLDLLYAADRARTVTVVQRYLRSRLAILRRLALHEIADHPQDLSELATSVLTNPRHLFDTEEHREVYRLLEAAYPVLSGQQQSQVIGAILLPFPRRRGVPQETRERWTKLHRLRFLHALRRHLIGDAKTRYETLISEFGEPDHPDFLIWTSHMQWGHNTPLGPSDVADMGPDRFSAFVQGWTPSGQFGEPTAEGLAQSLAAAVAERPEEFAAAAVTFAQPHLRGLYAYHLLGGLRVAVQKELPVDYEPVIDLCESLDNLADEDFLPDPESGFEPSWLRGAVAEFLQHALAQQRQRVPLELEQRILRIIRLLLDDPQPDEEHERQYGGDNMDAATLRLNTVRGKAIDALLQFALWKANAQGPAASGTSRLDPRVREVLEQRLRPEVDRSPAIRSFYGQRLHLLWWLDGQWTIARLPDIFPTDEETQDLWAAALLGHVLYGRFVEELYQHLRSEFRRALQDGAIAGKTADGVLEHIGQHRAVAYWRGLEPLRGVESLVQELFSVASPVARRGFLWLMGRSLREARLQPDSSEWHRLRELWEWRVTSTDPSEPKSGEEADGLLWWLPGVPEGLATCYSLIAATIERLTSKNRFRDASHLVEYLAPNAHAHPREAVSLIQQVLRQDPPPYFLTSDKDQIRKVLAEAMKADRASQDIALEVISWFGQSGDYSFRELLE